jgi:DNA polymerase-3 subunit alpha (Gram-positive type)
MPFVLYETELSELSIAAFDLETTGLYPSRHRIIQIAFVPIADGAIESQGRVWKVNPGDDQFPIDPVVLDLTHLDEDELRQSPTIEQVLPEFGELVGTRIVAGHNVKRFDLPFVRRAEGRVGVDVQTDYYIDTLSLARKLKPDQPNHKLATCAAEYGIPFDENALHDALVDTRLCADLLLCQIEDLGQRHVDTFGEMIDFLS